MPELPEAETIVRGLRPRIVGRTVAGVDVVHADVLRVTPEAFRPCVAGAGIDAVGRRGKNVVLELSGDRVLVVNLGMTGRLLPVAPGAAPPPGTDHPAVVLHFEDGGRLVFDDTRRFGAVECMGLDEWASRSAALGPEPLDGDFDLARFREALATSRSPIRSWLLDQRKLAGVGNIYANEALHRACVHPRRPARTLSPDEAAALHAAVRHVLARAVQSRGTTLRDYRDADGEAGDFASRLAVYGREGKPCPRCNTAVERVVFGNRSAFLCPRCQPPGPTAPSS